MGKYDRIIGRSRPVSHHLRMDLRDRAKLFAPFAALHGHSDAMLRAEEMLDPIGELERYVEYIP